jgi:hypothetical protein
MSLNILPVEKQILLWKKTLSKDAIPEVFRRGKPADEGFGGQAKEQHKTL